MRLLLPNQRSTMDPERVCLYMFHPEHGMKIFENVVVDQSSILEYKANLTDCLRIKASDRPDLNSDIFKRTDRRIVYISPAPNDPMRMGWVTLWLEKRDDEKAYASFTREAVHEVEQLFEQFRKSHDALISNVIKMFETSEEEE